MTGAQKTLAVGLTAAFGMQALRALLPLLPFLLGDRIGWHPLTLGAVAIVLFLTSFLAPWLRRLLGRRRLLVVAAGGVGLLRLELQLWTGDPLGELFLAMATTVLFLLFLATAAVARDFVRGLLLGLVVDTALHGLYGTYDVSWRENLGSTLLVLALVLAQWLLLAKGSLEADETRTTSALSALAPGPFLFLQMLIFQNVARLTALTGWEQETAFGWVLSSQILGLAPCWLRRSLPGTSAVAVLLFCTLLLAWPTGVPAALLLTAGHVASVLLLTTALAATDGDRLGYGHSAGMLLLVVFVFLYYSAYALSLPLTNLALPPLAALLVGAAAVSAVRTLPRTPAIAGNWILLLGVLPLLVLPMFKAVAGSPVAVRSGGLPLRTMTFNLHCGFDPLGHLGLEAIARVIEAEEPDVVGLQEVSRGWVVNGSVDMLAWLSRRLGMTYRFAPAADPLWGNAVLSRVPIVGHEVRELPPRDLLLRRGLVSVRLEMDSDEPLEAIVTHYHHRGDGSDVRVTQSRALLEFWRGRPRTVLMGDFNAVPGEEEIELLRQAGLTDAIEAAGITPGYTSPAGNLYQRIDYIWLSPDLTADDVVISPALVSDHLGVAATVDLK